MNPRILRALGSAEKAVRRLVDKCHKGGPLYLTEPKAVAQVSRTGKWLLNAITALNQKLLVTSSKEACE